MSNNKKGLFNGLFGAASQTIVTSSTQVMLGAQQQAASNAISGHISYNNVTNSFSGLTGVLQGSVTYSKHMLTHFSDEDIEAEYLKRCTPLGKALKESNES